MDLALITYNGWCAIKSNQTKPNMNQGIIRFEVANVLDSDILVSSSFGKGVVYEIVQHFKRPDMLAYIYINKNVYVCY